MYFILHIEEYDILYLPLLRELLYIERVFIYDLLLKIYLWIVLFLH